MESATSRVDWAAILAGAVVATAVGLILITFGAGIGLSMTSPYEGEGLSPVAYAIAAGLWVLWIQLLSFSIGGYIAARLRTPNAEHNEHETDVRDGLHGVLVWATGVLAAAVISLATLGGGAATMDRANGGAAASVVSAAGDEIDQAAAREAATNPQAADETLIERRAEIARKLTIIAAFVTAASLLGGVVAAMYAAGAGGRHRDARLHLRFFALRPTAPGAAQDLSRQQ